MIRRNPPRLFGIKYSNRDFRQQETWGKNQFNSSFPTSLACYMFSKHIEAVYLKANENLQINKTYISISELFGINPLSNNTYFAFETPYLPFQQYICGSMPRNDLVVLNRNTNSSLSSFEIKLTALPDQLANLKKMNMVQNLLLDQIRLFI